MTKLAKIVEFTKDLQAPHSASDRVLAISRHYFQPLVARFGGDTGGTELDLDEQMARSQDRPGPVSPS